ncbi:hypothetical protein MKX03_037774 [Papaver bracteatum]|nr:hypothetical protein MKX03_037774 [Papaver bracteatum]
MCSLEIRRISRLRDDHDAFNVSIGTRASVLEVGNFFVFAVGRPLLQDTSVKISHGKRYVFFGPNRTGKSTLLKLLSWGKILVPKNIDKSSLEVVVSANEELVKLRAEVATLQNLSLDGEKENSGEDDDAGDWGRCFTTDMQEQSTHSFSGGWRMRISLAMALFFRPTLLLLDEPTNHLDLRAVLWLEEYLCRWKKTLVVVSHDRDFLNTVCNEIIHLHDQNIQLYRGNFDDFKRGYDQRRKESNKKTGILDKQVKDAIKTGNPAPKKWRDYSVEFHFPEPTELTPPLMQLNGVNFTYPKQFQKLRIERYAQYFMVLLTMADTLVEYLLRLHPEQEGLSKQEAVRARLGKFGIFSGNHTTPIVQLSGGKKAKCCGPS